jgi:hypothetical protein
MDNNKYFINNLINIHNNNKYFINNNNNLINIDNNKYFSKLRRPINMILYIIIYDFIYHNNRATQAYLYNY